MPCDEAVNAQYCSSMPKVQFHFNGQSKEIEGEEGASLLEVGLENDVPIEGACGGNGFCTTCLCKIKKGAENLSERTQREESLGIGDDERLGCQARLEKGDVEVEIVDS